MNKAELIKRCEELGINPEPLTTNKLLKAAIAEKEAELAAEKEAADAKAAAVKAAQEKAEADEAAKKAEADKASAEKAKEEEAQKQAEADAKAAAEKAAAEKAAVYEDDRGRKWAFKKTAPKTINIDGHPVTQEEILGTEEFISELVYGKSSFLTLVKE